MVLQILVYRLVAKCEIEAALRIHVDRFLHVQIIETDYVFRRRVSAVIGGEMQFVVDDPVVENVVNRAVFHVELNQVALGTTVHVEGSRRNRTLVGL